MVDTVDEVGRAAAALGIDCDFARRGTYSPDPLRRSRTARRRRSRRRRAEAGLPVPERVSDPALGEALLTAACASLHPGQARPRARPRRGGARRRSDLRADQGHRRRAGPGDDDRGHGDRGPRRGRDRGAGASALAAVGRRILPLYSLVLATEPLPESVWDRIGLPRGATVTDFRHNLVYGQRTADDRLVFGGRGARYHLGSAIRPEYDRSALVHGHLEQALAALFPAAAGAGSPTAGADPLGVPTGLAPVRLPAGRRPGRRGGRLRGRRRRHREPRRSHRRRSRHRPAHAADRAARGSGSAPPRWEPEPLRFAGVNARDRLAVRSPTRRSSLTGRPSRVAAVSGRLGRGMTPRRGSAPRLGCCATKEATCPTRPRIGEPIRAALDGGSRPRDLAMLVVLPAHLLRRRGVRQHRLHRADPRLVRGRPARHVDAARLGVRRRLDGALRADRGVRVAAVAPAGPRRPAPVRRAARRERALDARVLRRVPADRRAGAVDRRGIIVLLDLLVVATIATAWPVSRGPPPCCSCRTWRGCSTRARSTGATRS